MVAVKGRARVCVVVILMVYLVYMDIIVTYWRVDAFEGDTLQDRCF